MSNQESHSRIFGIPTQNQDAYIFPKRRTSRKAFHAPPVDRAGGIINAWPEDEKDKRVVREPSDNSVQPVAENTTASNASIVGTKQDPRFQALCQAINENDERDMRAQLFKARMSGTSVREGSRKG